VNPTVLLLPGNMCDGRLWQGGGGVLLDRIASLGWPIRCPALTDATVIGMAQRLARDQAGALIPIGFSLGGIVALALARLVPERIAAIALLDTNAAADLPERSAERPRQQDEVRAGALEQVVIGELKPNYLAADHCGDCDLLDLLRDMALDLGPELFAAQSEALRTRPDLRGVLGRLDVPAFVACGAEDRLCPPEWHRALAAEAADAELHVIAGAGHMLPLEQPDALAQRLGGWLERVKGMAACPIAS
jgi:pimeloyl-ACP methyl ester carboxylesterase